MVVKIDGKSLTIEEVIKVARHGAALDIVPEALKKVKVARDFVEKKVEEGAVIYGLTTGFGKLADVVIEKSETENLQRNLILSHACAMGRPLPVEVVRAAMVLRINALSRGNSGICPNTLLSLVDMVNKGVHPQVPEKGSLGASGDLAPLAHIMLVLIGEGTAEYKGEIMTGKEAMEKAGIKPVVLSSKEGLALINGTQIMTAIGVNVLYDALKLSKTADIVMAMTGEALNTVTKAFDHKVQKLRGHQGQIDSAENIRKLLKGSENAKDIQPKKLQDPYSLRCTPQVHGATKDAISYVFEKVTLEINAVTDNPIIFPEEEEVISGGNFHGQPMALAFDFLKIAISELGDISERRAERLINPQLSEGLPPFLTKKSGVCSGFMIAQYSAASMVSENKIYAHPASVDSIPSSGNQEDHVSMGTTAARTAQMILDNTQKVLAIELFSACQGVYLRGETGLSPALKKVYDKVRERVEPVEDDVLMHTPMVIIDEMIKKGQILEAAEEVTGPLK